TGTRGARERRIGAGAARAAGCGPGTGTVRTSDYRNGPGAAGHGPAWWIRAHRQARTGGIGTRGGAARAPAAQGGSMGGSAIGGRGGPGRAGGGARTGEPASRGQGTGDRVTGRSSAEDAASWG